jgi:mycothiol synthase
MTVDDGGTESSSAGLAAQGTAPAESPGGTSGAASPATVIEARPYRGDRDWWRIRELLVANHSRVPHGRSWDVRRWDGFRFHRAELPTGEELASRIGVWETAGGRLVGAVHPEGGGDAYVEVDPGYRSLEPQMIRWAEEHLALSPATGVGGEPGPGTRRLGFWVADEDETRCRLLGELGYRADEAGGWMRCLRFDDPRVIGLLGTGVPDLSRPYRLRTTDSSFADCARMADLLNAGFGRTVHSAAEVRNFVELSPSFEHELNLVAVAPGGSFAATVGATYDGPNRHGIVEPVCTHPEHRRFGLARTLLLEALDRLRERGAVTASLDTGEGEAANALYMGCGFVEGHHFRTWRRELQAPADEPR